MNDMEEYFNIANKMRYHELLEVVRLCIANMDVKHAIDTVTEKSIQDAMTMFFSSKGKP